MQTSDPLLRTKLRLPTPRPHLVPRPKLQEQIEHGLHGPLTLITAPAGFGKTTLVASCIAGCGMPVAWLSLDKNDNQVERFLNYVVAAFQESDHAIGIKALQLTAGLPEARSEAVLTNLINDLDAIRGEIVLVLDDYQFISSQAVHEAVTFLLEHCPRTLHIVIATRSDPPLPLARLRARGQTVELRAGELSFTEPEAGQFLNNVMGLSLDARSVAVLKERTEGWIAGLQMAALSIRHREDIPQFIEAFSGTNRYILDYLLEEVLTSQSAEIQGFLLRTSILERLTAPLCDAILATDEASNTEGDGLPTRSESFFLSGSASILEYLERANLFLVPLDDEWTWYRYHHLFADLLRAQLQRSLGAKGVAQLHIRAAEWHAQNGSILEAIHHASMASDDERVERFIEQNYMELVSHGEQAGLRFWTGKLSKELVYRRPWLCIYEAYSHSWFGELDEAEELLEVAERRIRSDIAAPDALSMLAYLTYVRSRVTAMRGDLPRAIELCFAAREYIPAGDLALQLDTQITLGYEYFLNGDFAHADPTLKEMIRLGNSANAVINTVAASCVLARLYAVEGQLNKSYDTYQMAAQTIPATGEPHLGARALIEVGIADVLCEWNDLDAALTHIEEGLSLLTFWGKADDLALSYITLARIHLAQENRKDAIDAIEKATHFAQTSGIFPEAYHAVELARVKLWLAQRDIKSANRWSASLDQRFDVDNPFKFVNEVTHIAQARVWMAQNKLEETIGLLTRLEEIAGSTERTSRVIEILLLQALTRQELGDAKQAILALTTCLTLAQPEGYVRIFLDEGKSLRSLLARLLRLGADKPVRDYVIYLLSQFDAESPGLAAAQGKKHSVGDLIEPLTPRELEVLHLIALGWSNQEIAHELIVSPGTIKAHTASIYRKLEVANRTEAVSHARGLGILP